MTGIAGLISRPRRKAFLGLGWYVPALILVFLLGAYLNFRLGGSP